MLRSIPREFDPATVEAIDQRLANIRHEHHVAIPLAIESGSRAWGFPSPDSDYDCRFIFVRRPQDYLSPWPKRDVIETPLDGDLDVNGWDLAKALRLLLKGNAVIIEWLNSPIVYTGDEAFRTALSDLAERFVDRNAVARHYLHLGIRQRNTYFADMKRVKLKKLFYALRPAAALRWLRENPHKPLAPMHFPTLLVESDVPDDVRQISLELMARKAETRELGEAPLPEAMRVFIDAEFAGASETFAFRSAPLSAAAKDAASALFRDMVMALAPAIPSTPGQQTVKKAP